MISCIKNDNVETNQLTIILIAHRGNNKNHNDINNNSRRTNKQQKVNNKR